MKRTGIAAKTILAIVVPLLAAKAQNFAYVANTGSGSVSVIDTSSVAVVGTVAVGSTPFAVGITPDGSRAYVANRGSDSISVIDTSSNRVVATVGVGRTPHAVAVTPGGARVYVANQNSDSVSVIDTSSDSVVATVGVGYNPGGVAITPDGTRAYVTNAGSGAISVIDTSSNTVVASGWAGPDPYGVAITPDGARAYVTDVFFDTVSVIDTSSNFVVATVGVGSSSAAVAITPNGARAYVTNPNTNSVTVIDTSSNAVVATVGVGSFPLGVAITPDGARAYVTNLNSDSVWVIDTSSNTVVSGVRVGRSPVGVAVAPALRNRPPVANAGPDRTLECTNPAGTLVTLDGSGSSDPDHDPLTYTWTGPFPEGGGTVTGMKPSVTLPLGASTTGLVVNDGKVNSPSDNVKISIDVFVSGLLPPMGGLVPYPSYPLFPTKVFKQGRTLPLKLQLSCAGVPCTNASVSPPRIVSLFSNGAPVDLALVDIGAGEGSDSRGYFRFSDPNWVYNLSTKRLSPGPCTITIRLPDGRQFNAGFMIR